MSQSPFNPDQFFKSACLFEGSLLIVAIILGWIADINPLADIHFSESSVFYGIAGTVPLFVLFLILQKIDASSVVAIRRILLETLAPGLARCNWADLLILSVIAGVSEEVLFRGVVQPWIEASWGLHAGLVWSSVLFGLVHAITPLYALLATLVSVYLGLALDYGDGRNLLTPIIIHGLYDFLAFLVIMKSFKDFESNHFSA
jgi:membrane protease YdiL (CAAX protease family)